MADVKVLRSALKHGLSEIEVGYAWTHPLHDIARKGYNSVHVRVGCTQDAKMLEMLGERDGTTWVVFHAMAPTKAMLRQLGMR